MVEMRLWPGIVGIGMAGAGPLQPEIKRRETERTGGLPELAGDLL